MAEIVLFHHSCGVTPGVTSFARTLAAAGHTVHTPDLYEGRTFTDLDEGVAFADAIGEDVLAERAAEAVSALPTTLVYGGMSMGAARAGGVRALPARRGTTRDGPRPRPPGPVLRAAQAGSSAESQRVIHTPDSSPRRAATRASWTRSRASRRSGTFVWLERRRS